MTGTARKQKQKRNENAKRHFVRISRKCLDVGSSFQFPLRILTLMSKCATQSRLKVTTTTSHHITLRHNTHTHTHIKHSSPHIHSVTETLFKYLQTCPAIRATLMPFHNMDAAWNHLRGAVFLMQP